MYIYDIYTYIYIYIYVYVYICDIYIIIKTTLFCVLTYSRTAFYESFFPTTYIYTFLKNWLSK